MKNNRSSIICIILSKKMLSKRIIKKRFAHTLTLEKQIEIQKSRIIR